jgi:phosphoserine aminotransferase
MPVWVREWEIVIMIYNFGSGPGMMPPEVLQQAQQEMLSWNGSGISIMEMPFTGSEFQTIADQARQDLRDLLMVPDNFHILFMQGGASAQFSLVPMNLLANTTKTQVDYIDTGYWSKKAIVEAKRYCTVNVVHRSENINAFNPMANYCHITTNETADGTQWHQLPDTGMVPLIADMSSDFLSRPIDFSRFGLIYAGAQKNIGPAGLTIVLIREDLIQEPIATTPSAFSYKVVADTNGRFNTPLTHAIYVAGLVFQYCKKMGGIAAIAQLSRVKSQRLYQAIEQSDFYRCLQPVHLRSRMNVCFELVDKSLTELFLQRAQDRGLVNLAGHSAQGGIRASLYNAMPMAGVVALAQFMADFALEHQVVL